VSFESLEKSVTEENSEFILFSMPTNQITENNNKNYVFLIPFV
jgi:hypothetical protein